MPEDYEMMESPSAALPVNIDAVLQMEKAQIDTQIATAKKYPRDIQRVKKNMVAMATLDEDTAKSCFFVLPRGGRSIQGESVRLAEIALSNFGNIKAATRVMEVHDKCENPHVVVQAATIDLENNVAIVIEKRRRITKKKNKPAPDEDDINLAVNACSAIAFRDAVFKVIPKALIKPVYDAAVEVATGGNLPLESRIAHAMDKFAQMGVFEGRILNALNRDTKEEIVQGDLVKLIGYFNAIKDGECSIESCFPKVAPVASPEDLEKAMGGAKPAADAKTTAEAREVPGKKNNTGPVKDGEKGNALTPADDLPKSACLAEMKHHTDKPYYAEAVKKHIAEGFEAKDCPVSALRECVTGLRAAAEA